MSYGEVEILSGKSNMCCYKTSSEPLFMTFNSAVNPQLNILYIYLCDFKDPSKGWCCSLTKCSSLCFPGRRGMSNNNKNILMCLTDSQQVRLEKTVFYNRGDLACVTTISRRPGKSYKTWTGGKFNPDPRDQIWTGGGVCRVRYSGVWTWKMTHIVYITLSRMSFTPWHLVVQMFPWSCALEVHVIILGSVKHRAFMHLISAAILGQRHTGLLFCSCLSYQCKQWIVPSVCLSIHRRCSSLIVIINFKSHVQSMG